MNNEHILSQAFVTPDKKSLPFDLKGFLIRCLYHWPLFIIALLICIAGAYLYLKRAHPVYVVKAILLIKDDKKTPDQDSKLEQLDLVNSSKIIENEIEVLKSNQIMERVVKDLQLWITYQKKDNLIKTDLYKTSPVKFIYNPVDDLGRREIDIIVKDNKSFYIQNPNAKSTLLYFNKTYKSNFGDWRLEPTENISQFKGSTIVITLVDPENVALYYQKLIDVSLSNKLATALQLSVEDQNPQRGKDILNQLITNYNSAGKSDKSQQSERALYFINQRLDSLSRELNKAEGGIAGFKSKRGLTDISSDAQVNLDDMQDNARRLSDITIQLSAIESIERYVNSNQNLGAPSLQGITDIALSGLVKTLSDLQLQREKLLATTPETNPDFEQLNRQIARTKAEIKDNIKSIKSSLISTKDKLQSFSSGFKSSIKDIPYQERELTSKKRTQSSIENLYTYLLQKKEELSVNYASTLNNGRLVDAAYAGLPKAPIPALIYGIAVFLGLCLPAGLIYLRAILSSRVVTLQQIKDYIKIPVVIELPYNGSKNPIAINADNTTETTEQFRALRTKLHHLYADKKRGRVTLVASSIPKEGNSFVSSNLAIALAYAGKKTVLVELNMRKPKIAEIFNLPRTHAGFNDFVAGNADEQAIIQHYDAVPNLDVIICGAVTQNPSELLEQQTLDELFASLRNTYDDIIVNSPPVHVVPDAMIVSRIADLTLYIVRQGFTYKRELEFLRDLAGQKQLPDIHLVFNGINRLKYGYGYKYANPSYTIYTASKSNFSLATSNFFGRF